MELYFGVYCSSCIFVGPESARKWLMVSFAFSCQPGWKGSRYRGNSRVHANLCTRECLNVEPTVAIVG